MDQNHTIYKVFFIGMKKLRLLFCCSYFLKQIDIIVFFYEFKNNSFKANKVSRDMNGK